MKRMEFIHIKDFVLDLHHSIDKKLLKEGKIDVNEYNCYSASRNNFIIDLQFYLECLFDD